MCTSVGLHLDKFYFGRNLDLEYDFGDGVAFMPRSYPIKLRCGEVISRHFAIFGMGIIKDNFPLFADACNERGVCIAGLNFNGSAHYSKFTAGEKINLASFELIPYLLAKHGTAKAARDEFLKINLVDVPFNDNIPNTPLHFHLADKDNSYTLEFTSEGAMAYENPYNVLTNNPIFPFHDENAKLYMHLSTKQPTDTENFTGGVGAIGLPGDYTSPSRFVKAAWLAKAQNGHTELSVPDVFSTLMSVAPPRAAVITASEEAHFTRYTACIDTENLEYYYRTYDSLNTKKASVRDELFDTDTVILLNW